MLLLTINYIGQSILWDNMTSYQEMPFHASEPNDAGGSNFEGGEPCLVLAVGWIWDTFGLNDFPCLEGTTRGERNVSW